MGASYRLPPMDRLHRATVHKLAKYYFLRSESVGEEPLRSVVVHRQADCNLFLFNIKLIDFVFSYHIFLFFLFF